MIETILTETVDGGLVDSVWDYGGRYNPFSDSVFQWQEHRIGDARYSLDQIEKDILLGESFENKGWKEDDTLYLSQLFDWYSGDFEAEGGSIRDFVGGYTSEDIAEAVADTDTIRFIDYDWSLNKPANFPELKAR